DLINCGGDLEYAKRAPIHERIPFFESSPGPDIPEMESPRVIKSHLPYQLVPQSFWEQNCKVIYMARNAKDTMVSYYHFDRIQMYQPDPGSWPQYMEKFLTGQVTWGSWWDHVIGWWKNKDKHRILYLFFEDMKENPRREVLKIMDFIGMNLSNEIVDRITEHTSFRVMKDNPMANYTCTIFIDNNHFTVAQNEEFDTFHQNQMVGTLIPFRFVL
uniref:Sulfotransferase n=1 Tax=Eptatretus burgeri TaxID=7764 RepID=A0A8C4R423_EPTBU